VIKKQFTTQPDTPEHKCLTVGLHSIEKEMPHPIQDRAFR